MRLPAMLLVWLACPMLVLGACASEDRPEGGPAIACTDELLRGPNGETYGRDPAQGCKFVDDDGDVVADQTGERDVTTTAVSVTTSTTAPADGTRRGFCTTEQRLGPDGQRYGRSPSHGCQFVDVNGEVLPDQGR